MDIPNTDLIRLKGLGKKSVECLQSVGIFTREDLMNVGPVAAFNRLKAAPGISPSLNFLYAMVGALENRHWLDIAQNERTQLLNQIDGYNELMKIMVSEES